MVSIVILWVDMKNLLSLVFGHVVGKHWTNLSSNPLYCMSIILVTDMHATVMLVVSVLFTRR